MSIEEDVANQVENQQQVSITTELQTMNVELHSGVESQNVEVAHSDSEDSTYERDAELPDRDEHSDAEAERQNVITRTEPRLSKYVKRHHPTNQIIGDK